MTFAKASVTAALLLALAPGASARAAVHARVVPSVRAGAGWSSDLFLGARLGASAEAHLAPALRLDLSLSPRLKLWGEYGLGLGLYEVTRSTSLDHRLELGARTRITGRWSAILSAALGAQSLSVAQALDEEIGLEASETRQAGLSPSVRYRSPGLDLEALYAYSQTRHTLASGAVVSGPSHLGLLALAFPLGPTWATVAARYRLEDASIREFAYWGASLHGNVAFSPWSPLVVRLGASAHRNDFETGRLDALLKASLMPSVRLGSVLWLEGAYAWATNFSNYEDFDASRHFVYLGLRAGGELWRR